MPASAMPRRVRTSAPELLSFDVFGTLVDVRQGSRDAFAAILARSGGGHVDPLQFWEHWEHGNMRRYWEPYRPYREICRLSLAASFRHFELDGDPALIELYFDAFAGFTRFPDVDAVLDRLGQRYKLAVISNIDDDLLARTPLGRTFDLVCTAEGARGYKPDGTLFKYLLQRSALSVEAIFHSGQSQHTDLVGGKPLGFEIAWINRRGLARATAVPKPDYEFVDLRPLLDLLM
jgi:2-haloacid dehalogenase